MKSNLKDIGGQLEGDFFTDDLHKKLYATDASVYRKLPLAVALPKHKKDVQMLISFASKHKIPIIPRAAGTSLAGQCVGEGIVIDVSKYFTRILHFDEKAKTVTVQPGVVRDELNSFLKPYGLFFGPNTSTSNRCMLGGMVGNNSSGTTSIKYGVTRDKVLSLECVLSDGSLTTFNNLTTTQLEEKKALSSLEGTIYKTIVDNLSNVHIQNEIKEQFPKPEIHRRNTGYAVDQLLKQEPFGGNHPFNIAPLLCGSEGTLAFTTEITVSLDPLPPVFEAMIVAHYDSLTNALLDVQNVMQHELYACEMIDDTILNCTASNKKYESYRFFINGKPKIVVLLELKATSQETLTTQIKALRETLTESQLSYAAPVLKGHQITMAMDLRKAGLGLLGNMVGDKKAVACIEDTAVALQDLPAYIEEFSALMASFNQEAVYYAHAGAGELHLRPILNLKEAEGVAYFKDITTAVAHLTKKYKGSFSGEHGDGIVRSSYIPMLIGEKNYKLLKDIKQAFDPNHLFNPGKIIDALPMDASLRYETDQKSQKHNTLLDFTDSEGILSLAEKCNGSGDCRKSEAQPGVMCPSYQATKNEKDTTRGRANVLREVLTNPTDVANAFNNPDLKQVFDLCISCKACGSECPSNVDMATAKAEFLYQYHKSNRPSFATKLFGKSSYYNKQAARFPKVSNAFFKNGITAHVIKKIGGIAPQRSLPKISTISLSKVNNHYVNQLDTCIEKVYIFIDEFSKHIDTNIANDAIALLSKIGYHVELITHLDSARALLSKGFLEEAKSNTNTNIKYLNGKITATSPLLGIEPSAILGFRDEYLRMADDQVAAREIASHTYLFEEFIASEIEKGIIKSSLFTSNKATVKIHSHCHQKALSNQKHTFTMLNIPQNYSPSIMTTGCCGMAGSFGYEKEHYEVSMQIGELSLFPKIRKAPLDTIIAANGTSCREQIKDGTQRIAKHPITILKEALL